MNNVTRYSALQRKLHWLVVLLVALQFLLQSAMKEAMQSIDSNEAISLGQFLVTSVHTWGGIGIGGLMLYRLWLRAHNPVAAGAGQLGKRIQLLSLCMHWGFYGLLLLMALSGMLSYYFDQSWASKWHWLGKWLLAAMICLHTLAALLHHFWKKDDVLRQMLGNGRHTDTMAD